MLRAIVATAMLLGCGRIHFGVSPDDDADVPPDLPPGTPPVPASICNVDRIDIGPTTEVTELAATATAAGYAAIWLDGGVASGITVGPLEANQHPVRTRGPIDARNATQITGLSAVNQYLLIASSDGAAQNVLVLDSSFPAMASQTVVFPGHISGHDPFPLEDEQGTQAFLTAAGDTFELRSIDGSDGKITGAARISSTGATISQFSCDDGPDHGHCTWLQTPASGPPQYVGSDAYFDAQMPIQFSSPFADSPATGGETRAATGPADTLMAVIKTPSLDLEAHWLRDPEDVITLLDRGGTAPRIRWDRNDVFWIAWLDSQSVLQLASLDVSVIAPRLVVHPLPGWTPASPAAFELVRRRDVAGNVSEIGLVMISKGSRYLDFLSVCL